MNTIEQINERGAAIISKIKSGETLTKDERKILAIYNSLNSGKNHASGKRIVKERKMRIK